MLTCEVACGERAKNSKFCLIVSLFQRERKQRGKEWKEQIAWFEVVLLVRLCWPSPASSPWLSSPQCHESPFSSFWRLFFPRKFTQRGQWNQPSTYFKFLCISLYFSIWPLFLLILAPWLSLIIPYSPFYHFAFIIQHFPMPANKCNCDFMKITSFIPLPEAQGLLMVANLTTGVWVLSVDSYNLWSSLQSPI